MAEGEVVRGQLSVSGGGLTTSMRIGQRSYLSTWMLRSAKRSSAAAQAIEDEHKGDWRSPHVEEHMDHVISAVLTSATFLEAMVNELYTDAFDEHNLTGDGYLAPLDPKAIKLMADWWAETNEGMDRTLAKYQLLLSFGGQDKLDSGVEPLQSAALLRRLRNEVVHYKPGTVYSDEPAGTSSCQLRLVVPGQTAF